MANGLSSALNVKLPQTLVFDYPSVASMALFVFSLLTQPAGHKSEAPLKVPLQLDQNLPIAGWKPVKVRQQSRAY